MYVRYAGLLLIFVIFGCSNQSKSPSDYNPPSALLESVPTVQPEKMVEFSEVDTLFFGFLSVDTIPLGDGSFVLADPKSGFIVHIDSTGQLIKKVAGQGRGPGEFSTGFFMQPRAGGGFSFYDQINKKVLLFGSDAEYENEKVIPAATGGVNGVYDLGSKDGYMIEQIESGMLRPGSESQRVMKLTLVNENGDQVTNEISMKTQEYIILGNGGNARALPYGHRQLVRYRPATQTFMTYWTGSGTLAEINTQFDTLQTIAINIPTEPLRQAEIDSMASQKSPGWDEVEDRLPKEKTPVLNMRLGPNETYWLKLSYQSDFDQWLIVDSSGTPQKIVQFPKGTMLTHVSKHHLGVRMGPGTFALFEPVEYELYNLLIFKDK